VLVVCAAFALLFATQTRARAAVWRTPALLMADSARNYPHGAAALTREAHRRAAAGDVAGCVRALRAAMARGYNRLDHLLQDPAYRPLHEAPPFRAIMEEMANEMIARLGTRPRASQMELRAVAQAYVVLRDWPRAQAVLERALAVGGPLDEQTGRELAELQRRVRLEQRLEKRRRGASDEAAGS
jgi:hypothetical protein